MIIMKFLGNSLGLLIINMNITVMLATVWVVVMHANVICGNQHKLKAFVTECVYALDFNSLPFPFVKSSKIFISEHLTGHWGI